MWGRLALNGSSMYPFCSPSLALAGPRTTSRKSGMSYRFDFSRQGVVLSTLPACQMHIHTAIAPSLAARRNLLTQPVKKPKGGVGAEQRPGHHRDRRDRRDRRDHDRRRLRRWPALSGPGRP